MLHSPAVAATGYRACDVAQSTRRHTYWQTVCHWARGWRRHSSARVRSPCMPLAYCGLTAWRRQLCSRCSARSSSLSSLTPLRRGGASRPPSTDSVSMLFCAELLGLTCGHWLGRLTPLRSKTFATQLIELFTKIRTFSNHILHALLPPPSTASQNNSLRQRAHSLQLPERSTHLSDCNFLTRML